MNYLDRTRTIELIKTYIDHRSRFRANKREDLNKPYIQGNPYWDMVKARVDLDDFLCIEGPIGSVEECPYAELILELEEIRTQEFDAGTGYHKRAERRLKEAENWRGLYVSALEEIGHDEDRALQDYENVYGPEAFAEIAT